MSSDKTLYKPEDDDSGTELIVKLEVPRKWKDLLPKEQAKLMEYLFANGSALTIEENQIKDRNIQRLYKKTGRKVRFDCDKDAELVDILPLVKCKNCIYYKLPSSDGGGRCLELYIDVCDDDYCSGGKEKEVEKC